jgi:chaperonin GroEL
VALLRARRALDNVKPRGEGEKMGVQIVRDALTVPIRQLAANAGHEGAVVLKKVDANTNVNFGFNADTGQYEDLMRAGIIDPAKVVRCALENGSSVARVLLSTVCLVAEKPKEKKGKGRPGMPPGMDDDMGGMDDMM